jgi:hypothetical protein
MPRTSESLAGTLSKHGRYGIRTGYSGRQLPADGGAVDAAEVEVEYARRNVRVAGEIKCPIQAGSSKYGCARILQAASSTTRMDLPAKSKLLIIGESQTSRRPGVIRDECLCGVA